MEATADFYEILGVEPHADSAAIRIAYRNLMRRYHPDVNKSAEAIDKATAINEAYACLSDPDARASYDWRRGSRKASEGSAAQATWQSPKQAYRPQQWDRRPDQNLIADLKFLLQPHKWNWLNLSLAMTITACIFTATSFVSPIGPAPAPADAVQVDVQAARVGCTEEKPLGEQAADCRPSAVPKKS